MLISFLFERSTNSKVMAENGKDAAHTLADALQKIENILSDDRNQKLFLSDENICGDDINSPGDLPRKIQSCAHELRTLIEAVDPSLENQVNIPLDTIAVLLEWLQTFEVRTKMQTYFNC